MTGSGLTIKIGGSLCDPERLPRIAAAIRELAERCCVTIVPGGGPFACVVRDWDQRLHLSASAAHWMAIAAMDQYGLLLESQGMGVAVHDPAALSSGSAGARIFLPYRFLRETDPLPHSWSVTSDSIAAYLAALWKTDRLVLVKPADAPVSPCPIRTAVENGMVDGQFERYLDRGAQCWIVNGNAPHFLLDLQNLGTRVIPAGA